MAYIKVDIEASEIDLDELISGIIYKLDPKWVSARKEVESNMKELLTLYNTLAAIVKKEPVVDKLINPKSLDDQIKYEHLCKIFDKYTTAQIEAALPL